MSVLRALSGALFILVVAILPAQAQERILSFVSDVRVERNGDLLVTETIRVQAEGRDIRRGILRDFPTIYPGKDGTRVEVGFEVLSISRDGATENYATERLANGVRIRIGSADTLLRAGPHTYVINYRTTRQIGFFQSFDELYWNATGTGWTFAIDVAEARITLPENVAFTQHAVYTGAQGSRERNAAVVEQAPGRIVFRTTRPLPAHNGLTVAAAFPKGIVAEPTGSQRAGWWLRDNLEFAVAGGGIALLFIYYVCAWLWVGRDPRKGTVIPLFAPPDGLSAAAVRYIREMGFDDRVFAAALIDLGVRGHVKLADRGGGIELQARKGGKDVPRAEQGMEGKLFASKRSLTLSNSNHETVNAGKKALMEGLAETYAGIMFHANSGWAVVGLVGWFGLVAAIALCVLALHGTDVAGPMMFGLAFASPAVTAAIYIVRAVWLRRVGFAVVAFASVFIIAFGGAGIAVLVTAVPDWMAAAPKLAPLAALPLVAFGFSWLSAPTAKGREVMDGIEGLRLYLGTAEEERLEFLHPPDKTPELFERFLPYAIALDVENKWAARFSDILATAAAGAAVATWYVGDRDIVRDPAGFAERVGSRLTETISSASSAPASNSSSSSDSGSGSSGGGSSGGGGGGGGGSGW